MKRREKTEVLVVGAGPVGMVTALALAQRGVRVDIIDHDYRTAVHSYACALHPSTLGLLDTIGLGEGVMQHGRRIDKLAFYDRQTRQAEINFSELPGPYNYMVALPQSTLERLLEQRLKANHVDIRWNHRLSALHETETNVIATIEKLTQTVKGYGVPELDWVVEGTIDEEAAYVVGADGQNSFVRRHGAFQDEQLGQPVCFSVYEFELDRPLESEVRVILDGATTSVLWPLAGTNARWSFQIPAHGDEFPEKDRSYEITERPSPREPEFAKLQSFIEQRAPWFDYRINEMHWHTDVEFHQRLANPFYHGRFVLAGDAAHQTTPAAVQSMNLGMSEASELGEALKRVLHEKSPPIPLEAFDNRWHESWSSLLGLRGELRGTAATTPWIREQRNRILPCLPAAATDLPVLLRQVGLEWAPSAN